jgi:hypothetical protein
MPDRPSSVVVVSTTAIRRVALFFVLVAVVLLAAVVWNQRERLFGRPLGAEIEPAAYQAVFLTGGQVYFGKASAVGDHYLLSDVFYLATNDGTQSGQAGQLIKRGRELHGPREPMVIPNSSVLFLENLRDDGDVATAIRKFKAGEIPAATPTPVPPTATATSRPSASR